MLSKKEFDILLLLSEKESAISQREISQEMKISLGAVNKLIKQLSEKNYVSSGKITPEGLSALEPYRVKRAVFIAAGFGSRLVPLTFNTPKPLVRVHGVRMIDTLLDAVVAAQIPEIIIVRGYLGEQFDQLLYKYPNIKFYDNLMYNEANNISSALCVKDMLSGAYVFEADLVLSNKKLIRKYEYESNFLAVAVNATDDWCVITDEKGIITDEKQGGTNCHQMIGISYWSEKDGEKLSMDIAEVFSSPGGKERYWEQVPLVYKKENYAVHVRECAFDDIVEIDTFGELKQIDPTYNI